MTRRGSLVYYLTCWICGGFFLTVAMFLQERVSPEGLGIGHSGAGATILTTYFLVLVFSAFLSLLFAFLLRRVMVSLHAEHLWQWVISGTALAVPMAWAVRWASRFSEAIGLQGGWNQIAVLLFLGVRGIADRHMLLALPVAAATSALLYTVHHAFAERPDSSLSDASLPDASPGKSSSNDSSPNDTSPGNSSSSNNSPVNSRDNPSH